MVGSPRFLALMSSKEHGVWGLGMLSQEYTYIFEYEYQVAIIRKMSFTIYPYGSLFCSPLRATEQITVSVSKFWAHVGFEVCLEPCRVQISISASRMDVLLRFWMRLKL